MVDASPPPPLSDPSAGGPRWPWRTWVLIASVMIGASGAAWWLTGNVPRGTVVAVTTTGPPTATTTEVRPPPAFGLLAAPFDDDWPLLGYFDHELPIQFEDGNDYQLTWRGEKVFDLNDAHEGYDWEMPEGTPLRATAAGEVITAGPDWTFFCPLLGQDVTDQLVVEIVHDPIGGEQYSSVFKHVSDFEVAPGDRVEQGDVVAFSGNTGCSLGPHLHFEVWRFTNTNGGFPTRVDPYGWEPSTPDPWAEHPDGAESIALWEPGGAPTTDLFGIPTG